MTHRSTDLTPDSLYAFEGTFPNMVKYTVGEYLPGFVRRGEGVQLNFDHNGLSAQFHFHNITKKEARCFADCKVEISLVCTSKRMAFFVFDLDGFGVSDAPFTLGRVPHVAREFVMGDHRPFPLFMTLVDADSGLLTRIRYITLTQRFSDVFQNVMAEQCGHIEDFSDAMHDAEQAAAYSRYATPKAMRKNALLTVVIGGRAAA